MAWAASGFFQVVATYTHTATIQRLRVSFENILRQRAGKISLPHAHEDPSTLSVLDGNSCNFYSLTCHRFCTVTPHGSVFRKGNKGDKSASSDASTALPNEVKYYCAMDREKFSIILEFAISCAIDGPNACQLSPDIAWVGRSMTQTQTRGNLQLKLIVLLHDWVTVSLSFQEVQLVKSRAYCISVPNFSKRKQKTVYLFGNKKFYFCNNLQLVTGRVHT